MYLVYVKVEVVFTFVFDVILHCLNYIVNVSTIVIMHMHTCFVPMSLRPFGYKKID